MSNGIGPLVLWGGTIALLSDVLGLLDAFDASRAAVCVMAVTALEGCSWLRPLPDRLVLAESRPGDGG